jgi:hypothetical protein
MTIAFLLAFAVAPVSHPPVNAWSDPTGHGCASVVTAWPKTGGRVEWQPEEKPDLTDQLRAENKERLTIGGVEFLPKRERLRPVENEQLFNFYIGFMR